MSFFNKIFYNADGGGGESSQQNPKQEPVKTEKQSRTFTQEELNQISQKQKAAYKRMAEKRAEAIFNQQLEQKKLEDMPEIDRLKKEHEKAQADLQRYKTEAANSRYERELTAKGLPIDIAKAIPAGENVTQTVSALAKLKAEIETPLLEKIKDYEEKLNNATLRGTAPLAPSGKSGAKPVIPTVF